MSQLNPENPGILVLRLQTRDLAAQRAFYTETLNLRLLHDSADGITLAAGRTELMFVVGGQGNPTYHFAFNIPENKLPAALSWLEERTEVHRDVDGSQIYTFTSWNAHAVYFRDPAGNILEFIARHNLPNAAEGAFTERDILYASEIAITVDDVPRAVAEARRQLGLEIFNGTQSDQFAALGDDHRLLLIAQRGRPWSGSRTQVAEVHETRAELFGKTDARLSLPSYPYDISLCNC